MEPEIVFIDPNTPAELLAALPKIIARAILNQMERERGLVEKTPNG